MLSPLRPCVDLLRSSLLKCTPLPLPPQITFTVAVQGAQDEEGTAAEAQLPSPDMPRAPPTTPNPFYEAEDEEILVDFAPTPLASLSKRPTEAPEPVMDCGAQAEATPVPSVRASATPLKSNQKSSLPFDGSVQPQPLCAPSYLDDDPEGTKR